MNDFYKFGRVSGELQDGLRRAPYSSQTYRDGWESGKARSLRPRPKYQSETPLTTSCRARIAAPSSTSTHSAKSSLNPCSDFAAKPNLLWLVSSVVQTCSPGFSRLHSAQRDRTVPQSSTHISLCRQRSSKLSKADMVGTTSSTSNVECAELFQTPSSLKTGYSFPRLVRVPSWAPS
jgi:hypothetical protein